MKKLKRVFSFVMAFVMLLSGLNLAMILPVAAVDNNPTLGSTDVIERTGKLLTFGEWEYYVENGRAIVAGYKNEEENNLTIPFSLGGYPVSGIGRNAFSSNSFLTEIRIHTNVTSIASNAFEGLQGVTIGAYHGSYALKYASAKKMQVHSYSTDAEFVDGVIDLTGLDPKAYRNLTDHSVTFSADKATFIAVDQVLYFPSTTSNSLGFGKRVVSIQDLDGQLNVLLTSVDFGEVYESIEADAPLYLDWANAIYPEGITPLDDDVSSALSWSDVGNAIQNGATAIWDTGKKIVYNEYPINLPSKTSYHKMSLDLDLKKLIGPEMDGYSLKGSLDVDVTASASIKLARFGTMFTLKEANVTTSEVLKVAAEFCYKNSSDAKWAKTKIYNTRNKSWGDVSVPFFSVYGFSGYIVLRPKFEFEGSFSIEVTNTYVNAFSYRNGKWTPNEFKGGEPYINGKAEGTLTVGGSIGIEIDFGIPEVGEINFFNASVGLYGEASGSISYTQLTGSSKEHLCAEGKFKVYIEYAIKVGIVKFTSKIGKVEIEGSAYFQWPKSGKEKKTILGPFSLHFDMDGNDVLTQPLKNMRRVEKCELKDRAIIFEGVVGPKTYYSTPEGNGSGSSTKAFIQDVNDVLEVPANHPTKEGYKFDGWVLNTIDSKFSLHDNNVIPGLTRVPYAYRTGITYYNAKWIDLYPITSFSLNRTSIEGLSNNGETVQLTVQNIQPAKANNKSFRWSSSNSSIASVDSNGRVTLKNAGNATITATSVGNPSVKRTCSVTVRQSVTSIQLNNTGITRYSDNLGTVQLSYTVSPSNAYDKQITWRSTNTNVATVTDTGLVTLKGVGSAEIICSSVSNPRVTGVCKVTIHQAVTGIKLDKTSLQITNADLNPITLQPTVLPSNAYNKSLTWESSNSAVATVSASGVVTPKALGKTVITCRSVSSPKITATFNLEIVQAVTDIALNESAVTRYSDEKNPILLVPTVMPEDAYNKSVTWETSDPKVVTVSNTGKVTVVAAGKATVTCRSVSNPNVTATCSFNILQAVTKITVDKTSVETTTDEINPTYLHCTVYPANAYNKSVTWSTSDSKVAEVTPDGIVTIKGAGTTEIRCTSVSQPYISGVCTIHVELAVRGMTLNENSIVCYSRQKDDIQLIAYIDGVPNHDRGLTWTASNSAAASVSDSGIVKLNGLGESLITCTSQSNLNVNAQCLITVLQSVEGITLNEHLITRDTNHLSSFQLSPAVAPANAANKQLIWDSSNPDVAAVSDDGTILFAGAGTAVITCRSASDPDVKDTCKVTINQVVSEVELNYRELSVYRNEEGTIQLTAYVRPYHAQNRGVTWSSSASSVATVSDSGLITLNGVGDAVITCASVSNPEIKAECVIHVLQEVTAITLDRTAVELFSNTAEPVQLTATVQPSKVVDKSLVWRSSNEAVVSVTDNGLVTACGLGTAVISCYSASNAEIHAECRFTVNQEARDILLNADSLEYYNDGDVTVQLTANVQPGNTGNKAVTWSSSDSRVARVSEDGLVTLTGVGITEISCASKSNPEIVAKVTLTAKQPMTAIQLDKKEIDILVTDSEGVKLNAAAIPSDTEDSGLIWETSNSKVAVVSDEGVVTAVSQGKAEIYCRSQRKPENVFAVCVVNVRTSVQAIVIESDAQAIMPGENMHLTAHCIPDSADNHNLRWHSEDTSIATVNQNGVVFGSGYGTANVVAEACDGSGASGSYTVVVEHPLTVQKDILNDTVFAQGKNVTDLAVFYVSASTARRVAEAGRSLIWSLQETDASTDAKLELIDTVVTEKGVEYIVPSAVLSASVFKETGTKHFTVTCTDGINSTSEEFILTVDGETYASDAVLHPSTITMNMGETVTIPSVPYSADGAPIPKNIQLTGITGDSYFCESATLDIRSNGILVSFDESGVYSAEAHYECANIAYNVNLTFFVKDSDGIIRIRTTDVLLDINNAQLVQGATCLLKHKVLPSDAYDSTVIWKSTDEKVVRVDNQGVVTAVGPGVAAITCTAADGSGASAMCTFTVERFLQLDESDVTYTVYTGGNAYAEIGIINLTWQSEQRLQDAGLNVTWTLEKLDGDSCQIGIEEFQSKAEEGVAVSGNLIKLLRINNVGADHYRLICRAGNYKEECQICIRVEDAIWQGVPELLKNSYTGTIGQVVSVDTGYTCGSTKLPESVQIDLIFGNAMENALDEKYDPFAPMDLIFAKAGSYTAEVVFTGTNYRYTCPISLKISDEDGNVPANVVDVNVEPSIQYLFVGESVDLTGIVVPSNAPHSAGTWSVQNSAIATVSKSGTVTAIAAGETFVLYTIPEFDDAAGCYIVVEDGLTLGTDAVERTVFTDGITRTRLETVMLTSGSSRRLEEKPVWTLNRISGNNLTLKAVACTTVDEGGNFVYGCDVNLYSLSREGDAIYELTCTAGDETVSIPITVHAVSRNRVLPAGITLSKSIFAAGIDELILVTPEITCLPAGTTLLDGIRVSLEGDKLFEQSKNTADCSVSQSMFTVSFARAGLYTAELVYTYSNLSWRVPVTFRISDGSGNVPILSSSMELSTQSLWLIPGEKAQINATFTPANADNRKVTWESTDPSIATVDSDGNVTSVRKGTTYIVCTPDDPYLIPQSCRVEVEDYLTMNASEGKTTLYVQGDQFNEFASAKLSTGTVERLERAGLKPQWKISRISGTHTLCTQKFSKNQDMLSLCTTSLTSGGTDIYRVTCSAGEYTTSADFTVQILDIPGIAEAIQPTNTKVDIAVGESAVINFTPICKPLGSSMPKDTGMFDVYMGIGDGFYDALDWSTYSEDGDFVTVGFTKPGRYLLSREYVLANLHYSEVCEINVGKSAAKLGILQTDTTDAIVYLGGGSGRVARIMLTDMIVSEVFDKDITWNLERISGNSLKAVLKLTENGAELVAADAVKAGEDVWRVTCEFGDFSESVDIHIEVREAGFAIPFEAHLAVNTISGMAGDWLSMPIAAVCSPAGSALPEKGDDFWNFEPNGMAADVCRWKIEGGMLKVLALTAGYYVGTLKYDAGSFHYSFPIYITVTDEEGVLNEPALAVQLAGVADTVYQSGAVDVGVGKVELSRAIGSYYSGEANSYLQGKRVEWSIRNLSGTAAQLSIRRTGVNTAEIVLDKLNGTGKINYTVSCSVDGKIYEQTGEMYVSDSAEDLPDLTLGSRVYYAQPGEVVRISTKAYDRRNGSILQSSTSWNPVDLMDVIGGSYDLSDNEITTVFYKEGTYSSYLEMRLSNLSFDVPFTVIISKAPETSGMVMKFPAALTVIEEDAFMACRAEIVDLRGTRIERIESGAFKTCVDMKLIYIPSSVKEIADDAFYGCLNLTIVCPAGSAAEAYAVRNHIEVCVES